MHYSFSPDQQWSGSTISISQAWRRSKRSSTGFFLPKVSCLFTVVNYLNTMALSSEWQEFLGEGTGLDDALEGGDTAQEWINKGFRPRDRQEWRSVGEWCPTCCKELNNAVIFPRELAGLTGYGYRPGDYSNGNLDISDIQEMLDR